MNTEKWNDESMQGCELLHMVCVDIFLSQKFFWQQEARLSSTWSV